MVVIYYHSSSKLFDVLAQIWFALCMARKKIRQMMWAIRNHVSPHVNFDTSARRDF